jgi:hypothetical protein
MKNHRSNGSFLAGVLLLVAAIPSTNAQNLRSPLENKPYSGGVLMAEAIRAGRVQLPASVQFQREIGIPLVPGVLPDVNASNTPNVANEDPIAVSPVNALDLLTGANDYTCPTIQGFYLSGNGGGAWAGFCEPLAAGAASGDGDPIVGVDLANNVYTGGIQVFGGVGEIVVGQNGGVPVVAVPSIFNFFADKPWLEVDDSPGSACANNLYVSVTQFGANNQSTITVSTGVPPGVFGGPVPVDAVQAYPVIDQFSDLAVGSDGTVYVTWMRCTANGPTGNCGGTIASFYFSKSRDCGKTWTAPKRITMANLAPDTCGQFYGCLPGTGERVSDIPAIGVDNSGGPFRGRLYVTTYSFLAGRMRVRVHRSLNGGLTWPGVKYPAGAAKHDEFFPWINVSNVTGDVGVTWLDRRNDPGNVNYEAFCSLSLNGGVAYLANLKMASAPSNPFNDGFGGAFMGDYTGNNWGADGNLRASWMDTRNGAFSQDFVGGCHP